MNSRSNQIYTCSIKHASKAKCEWASNLLIRHSDGKANYMHKACNYTGTDKCPNMYGPIKIVDTVLK